MCLNTSIAFSIKFDFTNIYTSSDVLSLKDVELRYGSVYKIGGMPVKLWIDEKNSFLDQHITPTMRGVERKYQA